MLITTNTKAIELAKPADYDWKKLVLGLHAKPSDNPLRFTTIAKICGSEFAIWGLRTIDKEPIQEFLADAFRKLLPVWDHYTQQVQKVNKSELVANRHKVVGIAIQCLEVGHRDDDLFAMLGVLKNENMENGFDQAVHLYLSTLTQALEDNDDYSLPGENRFTRRKADHVMENLSLVARRFGISDSGWEAEKIALLKKHFG